MAGTAGPDRSDKKSKFIYTVFGTLRRFAGKARVLSGLEAGFVISGFCSQTSAASFLKMQTRHILFTDFENKIEVYESKCLQFSGLATNSEGSNPIIVKSLDLLWNFNGLLSKLKRKMATFFPDCSSSG